MSDNTYNFWVIGDISSVSYEYYGIESFTAEKLKQHLQNANGKDLIIDIDSLGGELRTAYAMYALVKRYKAEHKAKVTTRVTGQCASSATVLLAVGDVRIGSSYLKPFVHEPRISEGYDVTKDKADYMAELLESERNTLASFYSENYQGSKDDFLKLMAADAEVTPEDCVKYGFYTQLEDVALVAARKENNNIMDKKEIQDKVSAFERIVAALLPKEEVKVVNKTLKTSLGQSLEFVGLEESAMPEEGAEVLLDGKEIEASGSALMLDGSTAVIEDGKFKTFIEATDDSGQIETLEGENETLTASVKDRESEIVALKAALVSADEIIVGYKNLKPKAEKKEPKKHVKKEEEVVASVDMDYIKGKLKIKK